jgi:CRP-like cAMP-binding protein
MAVLDPAPRSATVIAGEGGVRALRLNGDAFREALNNDPAIASSVIRRLAQRLRD